MRVLLTNIIKKNGLSSKIIEAENGEGAIRQYYSQRPDLVLLDVKMPKIDGVEALRIIRKMDPGAKVLIISTSHAKEDVQDAMKLGACGYVLKPFNSNELGITINRALKMRV